MSDHTDQTLSKPLNINDLIVPEVLDNEDDNLSIYRFFMQKKQESVELATAYDLLGFCCSLDVCMESSKEPYKLPCYLLDRTSISEKLGPENLNILKKLEDSGLIKSNIVASRVSDLLYLFGTDRSHSRLKKTINLYKKMKISSENWFNFSEHQLKRAIDLCKKIQKKEADHLVFFQEKIKDVILACNTSDGYLPIRICEFSLTNRMEQEDNSEIFQKILTLARLFAHESDWHRAFDAYKIASTLKKDGPHYYISVVSEHISTLQRFSSELMERNNFLQATCVFEETMNTIRSVPISIRTVEMESALKITHRQLQSAYEKSTENMEHKLLFNIPTATYDSKIKNIASTNNIAEAIHAIASEIRIIEQIHCRPLSSDMIDLFSVVKTQDGRIVGRTNPSKKTPEINNNIDHKEIELFSMHSQITSIPIKKMVNLANEKFITTKADIIKIIEESSFVPKNRINTVALGILLGLQGDYVTAIHILAPQLENSVRFLMQESGGITSTLNPDMSRDNELGLSTLVQKPEFYRCFEPDIAFNIRAIFTEGTGANLRNNIAHGLLSDESLKENLYSIIYGWWLFLKITLLFKKVDD